MSCALMRQSQSVITNFYRSMTFTNCNGNVIGVISHSHTIQVTLKLTFEDRMNKISFVN